MCPSSGSSMCMLVAISTAADATRRACSNAATFCPYSSRQIRVERHRRGDAGLGEHFGKSSRRRAPSPVRAGRARRATAASSIAIRPRVVPRRPARRRQRLRQVVDDADAQRVHQILEAAGVGDQHDAEVLDLVTQPPRELQPVCRPEPRDVEQRHVHAFLLADRERLDRSDRAGAPKPPRGQRLTHRRGPVGIVTNDEYVRQFGRHHVPLCVGLPKERIAFRDGNRPGGGDLERRGL